jgi:hypothetical protein
VTSTTPVPINVIEGQAVPIIPVMNFTANDAGPFTATIAWGDASASAGIVTHVVGNEFAVSGAHIYAEDGSYTATVTITDTADSTTVAPDTTATVTEALLTPTAAPFSIPENSIATDTTATFTDPGSPDPASSFSATIDWGDGTITPGTVVGAAGSYSVTGSHAYADEGTHNVVTTFSENSDPGFTISITSTATVTEADTFTGGAIVIPPAGLVEGQSYSGPVATVNNLGFPGNPASDFTASINWGDGTITPGVITGGSGTFTISGAHSFAEEGTTPISVTIADVAPGTATDTITSTLTILDAPLTASPVAVHGTQGAPLTNVDVATFTDADPLGTVTDYIATIDWGDGTPVTAGTIVEDAAGTFHVQGSHTYAEEKATPYSIAVSITDNGNGRTVNDPTNSKAATTSPATIVQSPLLPVSNAIVATEGTAIPAGTVLASFTDTGGAGPVGDYTATLNWGDGSGPHPAVVVASGVNFLVESGVAFTYHEEGIFALTITVTDSDAGNVGAVPTTAMTTNTATVADAALTASPTQPTITTVAEGEHFTGAVASFTDGNSFATAADFAATIDWGDGSPTSLGTISQIGGVGAFFVNGTHTYKQEGTFTITVLITDDGGSRVTTTDTITVGDPPLTGSAAVPVHAVEGHPTGDVTVATFIDPDPNSTAHDWNAVIHWGDGTPDEVGTLVLAGGDPISGGNIFKVVGNHTYAEESPLAPGSPTVTITDVDTAANTPVVVPLTVTVVDAPLSGQGASIQAIEGIPTVATTLLGTFTDSNPGATIADYTTGAGSVVVNWGDGSAPETLAAANLTASGSPNGVVFSIEASHTYAEEGNFQVTITVTDLGGAVAILHGHAHVADAALTAAPVQPTVNATEATIFPVPVFGKPATLGAVGTFTDANPGATTDDFRAVIAWGDGTPWTVGTVSFNAGTGVFTVSGDHTYADAGVNGGVGTYSITVFVNDVGGSKLTITNTANVADNPIVLTGALNPASDSGVSFTDAVTNVRQPNFKGTSEPFSHVVLFETPTTGGPAVQIGQTQAGSDGKWSITSIVPLLDGSYTITATATDQFNVTKTAAPVVITPNLTIDTIGPRITGLVFNRLNGEVDYTINDERSGVRVATLLDSANYNLTKVHGARIGKFLVTNVTVTPGAKPGSLNVAVQFNGGQIIHGGFYLFTIRDSTRGPSTVQDIAGNSLDGEFYGTFPSGNNIVGGDFVAEIDAIHNKVFAPQTIVGTANAANNGVGGLPVGAVHSGVFTHVIPRGSGPVFTADPPKNHAVHQAKVVAIHKTPAVHQATVVAVPKNRAVHQATVIAAHHPQGPRRHA